MSYTSQCTESDDESNSQGPFSQPYASTYGFTATSWQLRKNLTETFDQHVVKKKAPSSEHKKQRGKIAKSNSFSITNKIVQYEPKAARSTSSNPVLGMGKPPRQPSSSNNMNDARIQERRSVSVYLRIRPLKTGLINTMEIVPDDPPTRVRTLAPAKSNAAKTNRERISNASHQSETHDNLTREYDFEEVFGPSQQNQDVYSKAVAPLVARMFPSEDAKEPESGLAFAFGASNSGKTYSILGKVPTKKREGATVDPKHWGILNRAIADIVQKTSRDSRADQSVELYLSYFEIYNEQIYDLLEDKSARYPMMAREALKMRETQNKDIIIQRLQKRRVRNVEEGLKLARQANAKRQTSSNNLNSESSRSHCICQLTVLRPRDTAPTHSEGSSASNGYSTEEEAIQNSKLKPTSLWIVDLAGSERNKRTNVGSLRQKEAASINMSLSNLMRCLSIIREKQSTDCSSKIIPFRESKLTHLFMPIFTGRTASNIAMVVNVSPAAPEFDETTHVLNFAGQARLVKISSSNKEDKSRDTKRSAGEYGYNGRPVKEPSALAKLAKKLSPKRFMKRANSSREVADATAARKRKAAPPALPRVASFSSTTSNGSRNQPKTKKMRVVKPTSTSHPKPKTFASSEGDVKSLKMALSIAQAEIEVLKSDKDHLTDELAQAEGKIRLEVSEEMEEQIESTKRHYSAIINGMKAQSRQSLGVFEKKAREEKASEQIETLLFKVEECEEELLRKNQEHQKEVLSLQREREEEREVYQKQIEELKTQMANCGGNSDVVEAQRLQISEQACELEILKKSKTDLIAAYEKLLAGEEDEESATSSEDETVQQASPQTTGPMTRTRSQQKARRKNY